MGREIRGESSARAGRKPPGDTRPAERRTRHRVLAREFLERVPWREDSDDFVSDFKMLARVQLAVSLLWEWLVRRGILPRLRRSIPRVACVTVLVVSAPASGSDRRNEICLATDCQGEIWDAAARGTGPMRCRKSAVGLSEGNRGRTGGFRASVDRPGVGGALPRSTRLPRARLPAAGARCRDCRAHLRRPAVTG